VTGEFTPEPLICVAPPTARSSDGQTFSMRLRPGALDVPSVLMRGNTRLVAGRRWSEVIEMDVAGCVADMLALEGQVLSLLTDHVDDFRTETRAGAALQRFQAIAEGQRTSLRARASALGATEVSEPTWIASLPHGSGETVRLDVVRTGGERVTIDVTRP
jgi:hypothetical protein